MCHTTLRRAWCARGTKPDQDQSGFLEMTKFFEFLKRWTLLHKCCVVAGCLHPVRWRIYSSTLVHVMKLNYERQAFTWCTVDTRRLVCKHCRNTAVCGYFALHAINWYHHFHNEVDTIALSVRRPQFGASCRRVPGEGTAAASIAHRWCQEAGNA